MVGLVIASLTAFALAILFVIEFEKRKKLAAVLQRSEEEHRSTVEGLRARLIEAEARVERNATEMQGLLTAEIDRLRAEADRIRKHYEVEALRINDAAEAQVMKLAGDVARLSRFESAADAETQARETLEKALREAEELSKACAAAVNAAEDEARRERRSVKEELERTRLEMAAALAQARKDAAFIRENAERHAMSLAGESYEACRNKEEIQRAQKAIENVIHGYGDRYVVPSHGVLEELAQHFGYEAAGQSMLAAQAESRRMVEEGDAAECDYVDEERRATAVRFVLDAFNGRVDAALSRVKVENVGTLEQEIRDAFALVNHNGAAFRNARIKPMYLDARLAELKWASVLQELRIKEREEQRKIREKIREEEKARREYERAMREAAREEDILKKAMAEAQKRAETASEEQKAKFEAQLRELSERLKEAEEKNQRAISMAQQTKRGHVYVISNVGSLGENIYKIGLTRRLEPMDRIWELGDASVPFDFDVHAMIFSEDAPALETQLHKQFLAAQVNKVNHRREFFKVPLKEIRESLEKSGVNASWTMTAAASEYRETLAIEKLIRENPEARQKWMERQLELDPVDYLERGNEEPRALRNITSVAGDSDEMQGTLRDTTPVAVGK